ncbi:MAG: DUF2029 domain-containing protein [Anaerolineae bacterium]|nr:DUF2029 domain-containing protein [Anaerolineae bacterium]
MRRGLGFVIILGLVIAAGAFVATQTLTSWDFRSNLWSPTHLLVTGRDPYTVDVLFEGTNAIWLPTSVGAFFAIGWLPLQVATNLWLLLTVVLYIACIVMLLRTARPSLFTIGIVFTLALLFPPFISHLSLGQYTVFAMALLMLAFFRDDPPPVAAGVLCALASGKPQLLILPVLGYWVYLIRQRRWGEMAKFAGAFAVTSILLTLPLWLGYSDWLAGFQAALGRNPGWRHPSLFVVLGESWGTLGDVVAGMVAVVALCLGLWRWQQPRQGILWTMALNLMVVPYVWSWDFVLLIPLFVATLIAAKSFALRGLMIVVYAATWILAIHIRLTTSGDEAQFWWMPVVLLATIVIVHEVGRRGVHPNIRRVTQQAA